MNMGQFRAWEFKAVRANIYMLHHSILRAFDSRSWLGSTGTPTQVLKIQEQEVQGLEIPVLEIQVPEIQVPEAQAQPARGIGTPRETQAQPVRGIGTPRVVGGERPPEYPPTAE